MGLLADSLRERGLVSSNEPSPGSTLSTGATGEFIKGVDSGTTGIGAGLRAMAGTVGEAFGADQFAQDQYAAARAAEQRAGTQAPRVGSYKDVGSLRDGVHYVAGLLGGSAPSIVAGTGAALATSGGAIPGLIAGTLAQTPIEAGDVALKQLHDPEAMAMGAGERSLRQFGGGLASAGLQSVVPNMLAGKIAGRTAGEAAKKTTGQIVKSNLAAIPEEGFFEGASDALKQTASNNNRALDWDSITENAVGGAVAGGAMSTVGAGAEMIQSAPTKSWIGAKGMAQDATQGVKDTLDPIWAQIKPSVDAGVQAMRSGATNAWEAMPESVKGAGEFLKTSFEDQTADAVAALKRIKEADDIPAEIKQQAMESGKALGLAANRAYVWSVDQARNLAGKAKDTAPEDIGSRLRGLTTPKDDTADRVAAGMPIGDEDPSIPGAVERGDAKAAEWAKAKGAELLNRTGLSDEKKAQLTQALGDVTDQANRAVVASIAKGTVAFDALSRRVNKAYEGMKAGIEQKRAEGGTKKSEDYSGFERQVVERAAPILQQSHPELFEAEGAKLLKRVGATLSMFMRSAADGQMVRMKTLNGVVEDMLGKDTAHEVLDSLHTLIEGNEEQVNNFYKVRAEMAKEAASREDFESMLAKFSTNEASDRSGIKSDPKEWASFLRDWAHGRLTQGMPPARAAFEDERVRTAVTKHFGTKAKNILAALDREVEQVRKDSGVGKNQFDSDEIIEDAGDKDSEEKDVDSRYFDAKGEASDAPQLYDHPDLAKGKAGFKSATQQALNRFRTANPDSRVYFVPLREYAKAHGLDEEAMQALAGDKDPGEVGYVKAERIKDDDSLRPNEIRRMTMASKYVKNKQGAMNPDAINVPGTTTHYDSKRIANIMHSRAKDEWSEFEDAHGMSGRLAQKFAEGIAALSAMHNKNLDVRDDQVIGSPAGKEMTWGEAKKLLADKPGLRTEVDKKNDDLTKRVEKLLKLARDATKRRAPDAKEYWKEYFAADSKADFRVALEQGRDADGFRRRIEALMGEMNEFEKGSYERDRIQSKIDAVREAQDEALFKAWYSSEDGQNAHEGRTETDPLNDVAQRAGDGTIKEDKLKRNNTELQGQFPDAKEILGRAALIMESESPMRQKLYDRVVKLAMNSAAMSGKDRDVLLESARRDSIVDFNSVVNETARKYAGRIVAPGAKGESLRAKRGPIQKNPVRFDSKGRALNSKPDASEVENQTRAAEPGLPDTKSVQDRIAKEDYEGLDTVVDVDNFLKGAYALWGSKSADWSVQNALDGFFKEGNYASTDLASFYEGMEGGNAELSHFGILKKLKEGTPDPKSVAAKKAAFLERAVSGDKDLIKELSTSNDAKGLQRAVEALYDVQGADAVLQAANTRLGELVAGSTDVAYGMGIKKYSLLATRLHSQREGSGGGFGATHDSPIKHEGKFDWRAHSGKGEGNASFGAGTYLSTAEGVHKSYKKQFTAKASGLGGAQDAAFEITSGFGSEQELVDAVQDLALDASIEDMREAAIEVMKEEPGYYDEGGDNPARAIAQRIKAGKADKHLRTILSTKVTKVVSPTYEVSVDIKPEQLLDWNAPLSEQSDLVRKALADETVEAGKKTRAAFAKAAAVASNPAMKTHLAAKALDASPTGQAVYDLLVKKLGSQAAASDYLQSLGILGHKCAASGGRDDAHPNYVIYDDSKITTNYVHFSKDATRATGTPLTAKGREQIKAYLRSATPWASVAFPNMPHAGEFTMEEGEAIVRVSAHALNPLSVAYHESLHAFFQHLGDGNMRDVIKVVMQTASKPAVTARLRELLAHSPEAQAQLKDAEERAAYMYQFWAQGDEKLIAAMGEKSTTFFGKLADYFRKLLGVWSNDERALHILEYFSSGEYGANVGKPDAAYEAMMETGRNAALEKLKDMAHSFMEMGEAVWGAGSANLRDSGIPALAKIADLVKRKSTDEGTDAGFLPAARIARAQHLDKLANTIGSVDEAVAHEALEALQTGTTAKGVDAERVRIAVRATLDDMYGYLTKAGVRVNDMGLGKDYFPRRWDATYLSKNKQKFLDMARGYPEWHNPEATFNRLISADGSEMPVVERPGMASKQERLLSFISAEDAAPFMSKNLYQIMNSYVSQATRRAEWARRFTDTNKVLENLLDQATKQGATAKQIDEAKRFVQGVNGTLGDDINPNLRRYMGNMMVYQNLRLLPLAVFSSVVDPVGLVVRGGSVGQAWKTFMRAVREVPAGLKGQEVQDHWTDMAETLGVIESATLNNALGSLYLQGAVGDTARRINDKFFRFNLMEQFNRSMHVGATEAAVKFLMKHKDLKGPHSARYLAELGLKPSDIQIAGGRVKLTTAEGLTEAQAAKIKSAVNMWVDGAILRPDAADKPVWMNDPKYMLVAHLKQFVYAFQHTILARTVHEFKHGNAGPALALTSYVPFMLIADGMKDFLVNAGDEPEWKKAWGPGQYLANSVERAGLLGVGQFGVDALTGRAGTLTGPTIEQLGEAVQVGGGNKQFKSMFIHSMPANAVYAPMLKAGRDEHFHPDE